jgi:membrane-associated protease RseP (regulator of RpoE activity)
VKSVWINIVLLIAVIVTTILTGSLIYLNYLDLWSVPNIYEIFTIENLFFGTVLFAIPLLSILIIHEMGHFFVSKKHGVPTSLPFFIPIPPIVPGFNIGTFGAIISSREPMPNKKALMDIGIAGPLAGFFIALPVTIIGIATSEIIFTPEIASGETVFGTSYLFLLLGHVIHGIPFGTDFAMNMNPIAFAGWVGLLITSINLFPAGQLDGGHIFRAFLGEKQKYASYIAVIIMILTGWVFFAFIILFMIGSVHPPPLNDSTKLDTKRKLLFLVALAILILCYIPYPIHIAA